MCAVRMFGVGFKRAETVFLSIDVMPFMHLIRYICRARIYWLVPSFDCPSDILCSMLWHLVWLLVDGVFLD